MHTHAPTQSAAESARQVLALLSDYAVLNELEQFFAREWEIASRAAEKREAMDEEIARLEEEVENLKLKGDALADAAGDLIDAIEDRDSVLVISRAKHLKQNYL